MEEGTNGPLQRYFQGLPTVLTATATATYNRKNFATLTIPKASGRYNRRYVCWEARAEYSINSSKIASFRHRMSCRGMSHCHGTRCQGISICKRQVVSWYKAAEFSAQQVIMFCACIWHFSSWWHPSQDNSKFSRISTYCYPNSQSILKNFLYCLSAGFNYGHISVCHYNN